MPEGHIPDRRTERARSKTTPARAARAKTWGFIPGSGRRIPRATSSRCRSTRPCSTARSPASIAGRRPPAALVSTTARTAHPGHDRDGQDHVAHRKPLVGVGPSLEDEERDPVEPGLHDPPGVGLHLRAREPGDLGELRCSGDLQTVDEFAQPGAEHEAQVPASARSPRSTRAASAARIRASNSSVGCQAGRSIGAPVTGPRDDAAGRAHAQAGPDAVILSRP